MAKKPKTYVWFRNVGKSPSGVTEIWEVVSEQGGDDLGVVKWMAPWRRYAFFPSCETVYDADCLKEIGDWCRHVTNLHKGAAE